MKTLKFENYDALAEELKKVRETTLVDLLDKYIDKTQGFGVIGQGQVNWLDQLASGGVEGAQELIDALGQSKQIKIWIEEDVKSADEVVDSGETVPVEEVV